MPQRQSQPRSVNVLISAADWAWPQAVRDIFQPRGINALIANSPSDVINLVASSKIHLAILDAVLDNLSGMNTLKMARQHDPLLPCILLAREPGRRLLAEALALDVFSVLAKPVDLDLLARQLDRLFHKYYASDVFSVHPPSSSLGIDLRSLDHN